MKSLRAPSSSFKPAGTAEGFILLDALVAIVIFSVGIVGMVALQSSAIQLAGAANYRLDAALLTDQVIAQMWASDPKQLQSNFAGDKANGGANYLDWMKNADCTSATHVTGCLPGVPANPPSIQIAQETLSGSSNPEYRVTVTVNWQSPSDANAHSYISVTDIGI